MFTKEKIEKISELCRQWAEHNQRIDVYRELQTYEDDRNESGVRRIYELEAGVTKENRSLNTIESKIRELIQ